MKKAIILSIGYDHYALPASPAVAGKLLELLADATACRKDYRYTAGGVDQYRLTARRSDVSVQIVGADQILPPEREDLDRDGAVDIRALPGAMKLLKNGGAS